MKRDINSTIRLTECLCYSSGHADEKVFHLAEIISPIQRRGKGEGYAAARSFSSLFDDDVLSRVIVHLQLEKQEEEAKRNFTVNNTTLTCALPVSERGNHRKRDSMDKCLRARIVAVAFLPIELHSS